MLRSRAAAVAERKIEGLGKSTDQSSRPKSSGEADVKRFRGKKRISRAEYARVPHQFQKHDPTTRAYLPMIARSEK
jgi:hypothetical protein